MARLRHLAPGMEPEFGLCFRGRLWDELVATGAAVHDLGPVRLSRPWTVWRARRRLRQVLADTRSEVVVTHDSWPHTVFAPVVRRAGIRLVHFVHGDDERTKLAGAVGGRTPPDLVVANSRFTAGSVGNVFPGARVEAWHYPSSACFGNETATDRGAVRTGDLGGSGSDPAGEPTGTVEGPGGAPGGFGAAAGRTPGGSAGWPAVSRRRARESSWTSCGQPRIGLGSRTGCDSWVSGPMSRG